MANEQTFEGFSGNDFVLHIEVKEEDLTTPVDISGFSAIIWALAKAQGKPPKITKTLISGIAIIDGPAGKVDVELSAADTEPLKAGDYYQEMRLTDASGKKVTVLYGTVTILANSIED